MLKSIPTSFANAEFLEGKGTTEEHHESIDRFREAYLAGVGTSFLGLPLSHDEMENLELLRDKISSKEDADTVISKLRTFIRDNQFFETKESLKERKELSPEQKRYMEEYKERICNTALGGSRINKEKLQEAIAEAYEIIGHKPPELVIVKSPKEAIDLLNKKGLDTNTYLYGAQDLYWISFYKFCQMLGVEYEEGDARKLDIIFRISIQCEWWWPFDDICICSEKTIETHWDQNKLLHREDGPAVLYEDGFGLYAWHGTAVPGDWIEGNLTAQQALQVDNAEQKRCAFEILGWEEILKQLKPAVINQDPDPEIGVLLEVDIPDVGRSRFLKMKCGTGRYFYESVPLEMSTALEANAWMNHEDPEEYKKIEFRT